MSYDGAWAVANGRRQFLRTVWRGTSSLDRIRAPTVIVWGDCDSICPEADQERLQRAIEGARLVTLRGAGHAVHWEQPGGVAQQLAELLHSTWTIPRRIRELSFGIDAPAPVFRDLVRFRVEKGTKVILKL